MKNNLLPIITLKLYFLLTACDCFPPIFYNEMWRETGNRKTVLFCFLVFQWICSSWCISWSQQPVLCLIWAARMHFQTIQRYKNNIKTNYNTKQPLTLSFHFWYFTINPFNSIDYLSYFPTFYDFFLYIS